jgi:hypothetical protein
VLSRIRSYHRRSADWRADPAFSRWRGPRCQIWCWAVGNGPPQADTLGAELNGASAVRRLLTVTALEG